MTARELSREVRAVDARALEAGGLPETDEDGVEDVPRETVWLRVTPRVRARWGRARLVACRVAGESLSQAAVAEAIAAEVVSAIGLEVDAGFTAPLSASCKRVRGSRRWAGSTVARRRGPSPVVRAECKRVRSPGRDRASRLPCAARRESRVRRPLRARCAAAARTPPRAATVRRDGAAAVLGRASANLPREWMFEPGRVRAGISGDVARARPMRCCGSNEPARIRRSCERHSATAACPGCRLTPWCRSSRSQARSRGAQRGLRTPKGSRSAASKKMWSARSRRAPLSPAHRI